MATTWPKEQMTLSHVLTTSLPAAASKAPSGPFGGLPMSVGLIALIVLGSVCLILGAIYGYIYFTRINPRSGRARKYTEQQMEDDSANQGASTHLFLFRKS